MRFLPFKVLLALVIMPPVIYLAALQGLTGYLQQHYQQVLERQIPGDPKALLEGSVTLAERIARRVEGLRASSPLLHLGVKLNVTVATLAGQRIYPPAFDGWETSFRLNDPVAVAGANYALLNHGLEVQVELQITQNAALSNVILAVCVLLALAGLGWAYRRGTRAQLLEETRQAAAAHLLQIQAEAQRSALEAMLEEKTRLMAQLTAVRSELDLARQSASRNEDALFNEVAALEDQLQNHLAAQKVQQEIIDALENRLSQADQSAAPRAGALARGLESVRKRFETLYKNTDFSERALKGFGDLPEPLQIKAEAQIHQLDADPEAAAIKRKLFRGKGKETVFEIVFARKGRLYFRRGKVRRVEVLAIGTKNTQTGDLAYLDRLDSEKT